MVCSEREGLKAIRYGYNVFAGKVLIAHGLYSREPVNTLYFSTWMNDLRNDFFAFKLLGFLFKMTLCAYKMLRNNLKYCVMNVICKKKKIPFLLQFFIMTNTNSPFEVYGPSTVMCRFTSLIYALPRNTAPPTVLMNWGRNAKSRDVWMNLIDHLGHPCSLSHHFLKTTVTYCTALYHLSPVSLSQSLRLLNKCDTWLLSCCRWLMCFSVTLLQNSYSFRHSLLQTWQV